LHEELFSFMIISRWILLRMTDLSNKSCREYPNTQYHLTFRGPCIASIFLLIYFQQDATLHSSFLENCSTCFEWYLHPSSGAHNCIYSIWYLSNRYWYLSLLWKNWNWFECSVGIVLICFGEVPDVRQQPHQNRSGSITIFDPRNLAVYGLIWKNMMQPEATDGNVIRHRKDALWLPVS